MKLILIAISTMFFAPAQAAIPMAITFDDLPAAGDQDPSISRLEIAQKTIDQLKKKKLSGVYGFANGILAVHMAERLEILKLWKKLGFLIGNHTYSHKDLGAVSADDFIADIEKNESILIDYAGTIEELKWLRYPFLHEGETNEKRYAVRSYLAKRNYKIAPVSVDFEDWEFNRAYLRCAAANKADDIKIIEDEFLKLAVARLKFSEYLAKTIYGQNRVFKHVLLLHLSSFTARMLTSLMAAFEKEKVKWISFKEALSDPAYKEDTAYIGPVGKTFLQKGFESRGLKLVNHEMPQKPAALLNSLCQ